ncbi:unnamed protein product, partial [marine sediment metagenome]
TLGVGSVLAGKVSRGKVELGLVPIGALGITICSWMLTVAYHYPALLHCTVIVLGISSGLFIIPLNSFFQEKSPDSKRGRYLAVNNFLSYSA